MFNNDEKSKNLLVRLGIRPDNKEYEVLYPSALSLVTRSATEPQVNLATITKVKIYDYFIKDNLDRQQENIIGLSQTYIAPNKLHSAMNTLLKKLGTYMADNNSENVNEDELKQMFNNNAKQVKLAKDLLDHSALFEKDDGVYSFKSGIRKELVDYFVADRIFQSALINK